MTCNLARLRPPRTFSFSGCIFVHEDKRTLRHLFPEPKIGALIPRLDLKILPTDAFLDGFFSEHVSINELQRNLDAILETQQLSKRPVES